MKVAIIKYNAGNIRSVWFALKRLGLQPIITEDPAIIKSADRVIFPGVGQAATTMQHLRQKNLDTIILSLTQPVLGICLGMQLMCRHSEEGNTQCLGIFDLPVIRFESGCKIPHMGWNQLTNVSGKLIKHNLESEYVYFVHSYYVPAAKDSIAVSNYGLPFSAALRKDNFYATQFHPEKSGHVGEQILKNFIELR